MSRGGTASAVASRYVRIEAPFALHEIRLDGATEDELRTISAEMGIGLSLDEMQRVREYFARKKRAPTDVELEALGQAWSEHCCYKSSKPILQKHVYGIAEHKVVARGDAGAIEFDDHHYLLAKIESHNHPSAIEPYGGAATGVGGILRDILCCGGQPIALVDPLFFGPPDLPLEKLPKGVKHPRYLFQGVVEGIRDYGNRVGIPTVAGMVHFHPEYTWNCLVNAGCLGIVRKDRWVPNRAKEPGNVYIYAGGPTGRDGIHGVTFASAELGEESEDASRSAVQVGDAILKEPLIHAVLECVERGLVVGMKDFGGGGLSCVAGELAHDADLGAEIRLERVPLKEEGLAPWEIWVSESQERMMLVVAPEKTREVLHVFQKWDVAAVEVGRVVGEPVVRAFMNGTRVLELDLAFSTAGPVYERPVQVPEGGNGAAPQRVPAPPDEAAAFLEMLARWNVCSKEWVVRQYDHAVRAATVLQPLQGKVGFASHGDAAVLKPLEDSWRGVALAVAVNPRHCQANPYWGGAGAMDEAVRNLAAVGARLAAVCDNLNFGNPEDPLVMGQLQEVTRGLAYVARELDVPFSSGNVSLYNDNPHGPIPPTPTLMAIGIVEDVRRCVTSDLKAQGDALFLVGADTQADFGGSEYAALAGVHESGGSPRVDAAFTKRAAQALVSGIEGGLVRAAHDVSEGGLAVAVAEMAFGGDVGATVHLEKVGPGLAPHEKLYAETPTRWVVEVEPAQAEAFRAHFRAVKVPVAELGLVGGRDLHFLDRRGATVLRVAVDEARRAWSEPLHRVVAG